MMKNSTLITTLAASLLLTTLSPIYAATSITGTQGVCTPRSGSSHASTVLFFGDSIRNVVATTNEFQRQGGNPISQDTNLVFDVWQSNGVNEGDCIGNITVSIDGGTNERAEVILEDILNTPVSGTGVLVRTGQLDARKKIDTYVEIDKAGKRRIVWNNFTGIPNPSRLMSGMRFAAGQHLAIYYTGTTPVAEAKIQLYGNAGNFVGVAEQDIGRHSTVVTDDVLSLSYKDLQGNPILSSAIPKDGKGYLRIIGLDDDETEASCMILYSKASPDTANGAWDNSKLETSTITFARRNGGNDPLGLAE